MLAIGIPVVSVVVCCIALLGGSSSVSGSRGSLVVSSSVRKALTCVGLVGSAPSTIPTEPVGLVGVESVGWDDREPVGPKPVGLDSSEPVGLDCVESVGLGL